MPSAGRRQKEGEAKRLFSEGKRSRKHRLSVEVTEDGHGGTGAAAAGKGSGVADE